MMGSGPERCSRTPTACQALKNPVPLCQKRQSQNIYKTNPLNGSSRRSKTKLLRKEVIQPHLPVRLPCYDFVPITSPTFDRSP